MNRVIIIQQGLTWNIQLHYSILQMTTYEQFSAQFTLSVNIYNPCEKIYQYLLFGSNGWQRSSIETSFLPLLLKLHRLTFRALHSCGLTMVDPNQRFQPSLTQQFCWRWLKVSRRLPYSHATFTGKFLNENVDNIRHHKWHDKFLLPGSSRPSFRSSWSHPTLVK